jgi:hypothetical protein
LPKGYVVDSADSPAPVIDTGKIGSLNIAMQYDQATRLLKYKRDFFFGANGKILFPANMYLPIRSLFGQFHKADTHMITLKQE